MTQEEKAKAYDKAFEKAMVDAGYTFDFEKKELKKIIDEKQIKKNLQDNSFRRMFEHKSAWSKEDDNCLSTIIAEFSKCAGKSVSKDEWMRCNDFLHSFRDRVKPKQEWSEEDERAIDIIKIFLEHLYDMEGKLDRKFALDWLKSLKERIGE